MGRRCWSIYLCIMTAAMPVYFLVGPGGVQRALFYAFGLSSVAAILVGVHIHRPVRRVPWLAFAVGLLLFALGDIAFDILAIGGHAIPSPSYADGLYFASYPVLALGLILLVNAQVKGRHLVSTIDGVIVAIGGGVVAWVFLMAPYAGDSTLSVPARLVAIAYPALDLLLVAVVARLITGVNWRNASFGFLAMSVVALVVADALFAVGTLHGTYRDGSLVDLGWIVSYACWGTAALHPSMRCLTDARSEPEVVRGRRSLAVLAIAALAAPAVLVVQDLRHSSVDVTLLAVTSAVLFFLVLARMDLLASTLHALYLQVRRAEVRQHVLTDAAVAFVGAGDAEAVATAAVAAAVALGGRSDSWAEFATEADCASIEGDEPSVVRNAEGISHFAAPIRVDGELRGMLSVGRIVNGTDEFLVAFRLLCSQMGLALQTAEATEQRMRVRNERMFGSLIQHSVDVVTLVGPDRIVRYRSPGVEQLLGRRPEELVGRRLGDTIHPADLGAANRVFDEVFAGALGASAHLECRMGHTDGSWRTVDIVTTNLIADPDVGAVVLNTRDVTDRRSLEKDLKHQAFHDGLTGLANRALFVDRVGHALDRSDRLAAPIAVVFLDLDDFKTVNDSLGHPAGDRLLVGVAERLELLVRPGDTVARLGGDEFALLLEYGEMPDAARAVALRLADVLSRPFLIGADEVTVQASVGIAIGEPRRQSADELLMHADLAMYMAKRNGKGTFEVFAPAMHDEAVQRLEIAADLRRALEFGQFEVVYQPIVSIDTASVSGAEALVRWHHPTKGIVYPSDFISIAESTGLIVPLDAWVLGEACRQTASWRRARLVDDDFYISVNLSARQLQSAALIDGVASVLRETGLAPSALVLEVTESVVMENFDTALARLAALKELGLRLAVDDFGTGYSSLSYLRNLPVDVIKIDKSFVDRLTHDAAGAAMVRSVIDLGNALRLTSIAEGVEDEQQLALLTEFGCDKVQGYLFARPMHGSEIPNVIARLRANASTVAND
jgi:diguanylate cyclase (GGDEF)-like protein/PAS domain S-box-containing protein